MSYNSKYTGQQVESLLDQVASGNAGGGGGGTTVEIDPIFSASAAAKITDNNISSWDNKVDKVNGKQLSTEDFTTLLKEKLVGLTNYDDAEIQEVVSKLRTDLDTLVSGDTTTAIKTFNEIIAFLDGISDTEDLSSIIASIEQQIDTKQDKLVSGTNIKTINGESILGEGDIVIEGGSSNGVAYPVVMADSYIMTLKPNVYYLWTSYEEYLDISFDDTIEDVVNEYIFEFKTLDNLGEMPTIILPDSIKWVNGEPTFEGGKRYVVSVVNNIGLVVSV